MLGQDRWIPNSLISITRDYKSSSCLLGSCREHHAQEELHVSFFFWVTLIITLGDTQKSAACFAFGSWLASIKWTGEGEALKMSEVLWVKLNDTAFQHEKLVWCQEEHVWNTGEKPFQDRCPLYRGPYIGCTYPYTAASLVLCLLKLSLLYVGGVGYAEKWQSSSQSPCCILKVKTRNSLAFFERSLNGTELFNHMHCSTSTVSSISFSAGLCELIDRLFSAKAELWLSIYSLCSRRSKKTQTQDSSR